MTRSSRRERQRHAFVAARKMPLKGGDDGNPVPRLKRSAAGRPPATRTRPRSMSPWASYPEWETLVGSRRPPWGAAASMAERAGRLADAKAFWRVHSCCTGHARCNRMAEAHRREGATGRCMASRRPAWRFDTPRIRWWPSTTVLLPSFPPSRNTHPRPCSRCPTSA